MIPNVLSIAGTDPSGGAGAQADLKSFSAHGAFGMSVVTALVAQTTTGVAEVHEVPPEFVTAQLTTLLDDVRVDAVKIGMLANAEVIRAVVNVLDRYAPPHVVLDPVMVAKSGDLLLERRAVGALREALLPQATLLTPNLPEAGVLLDERPVETLKEMRRVAERLRNIMAHAGQRWVMLKGGHLPGDETVDLLYDGDRMIELPGQRVATRNTHGTGCTLSAALAALLPQSEDVPQAAHRAKAYLAEALRHADRLQVGSGHGPTHHFHAWW